MPTILIVLALVACALLAVRQVARRQLYHKAHPSLEQRRKELISRSFTEMTPLEDLERQLDNLKE